MSTDFFIKRNDTSPAIQATLQDSAGSAVSLVGATVKFILYDYAANEIVNAAATVTDAANGVVQYNWQAADTAAAGFYRAEFEVTYADSTVETFPNYEYININIYEDLA